MSVSVFLPSRIRKKVEVLASEGVVNCRSLPGYGDDMKRGRKKSLKMDCKLKLEF